MDTQFLKVHAPTLLVVLVVMLASTAHLNAVDTSVVGAPAPLATSAAGLLERPLTFHVRQVHLKDLFAVLTKFARPQDGEGFMLLAGDPQWDTSMVDIEADHEPLRHLLERVCPPAGWRWRSKGLTILFDRPLPAARLAALTSGITQALAQDDLPTLVLDADGLAGSGDLDASAALLAALANPRLDAAPLALGSAEQEALLTALASNPPSLLQAMPPNLPLRFAANDARAMAGLAAAWRRAIAGQAPLTPLLCTLTGVMGYDPAIPDLCRVARSPQTVARDLDPKGHLQGAALLNLQRFALWSLGQLNDRSCLDLMHVGVAHPEMAAVFMCLDALEALHDSSCLDAVVTMDASDHGLLQASQYLLIARLAPQRLAELLPPHRALPPQETRPVPTGWIYQGIGKQPVPAMLAMLVDGAGDPKDYFCIGMLSQMFPHLTATDQKAVVSRLAAGSPQQARWADVLGAIGGDIASYARLVRASPDPRTASAEQLQTLSWISFFFTPEAVRAQLEPMHAALRGCPPSAAVYNLLAAAFPEDLPAFLKSCDQSAAYFPQLLMFMEIDRDPSSIAFFDGYLQSKPLNVLPNLYHLDYPRREVVAQLLDSPQPAVAMAAVSCLARSVDTLDQPSLEHLIRHLEVMPVASIDEALCRALRPPHGDHFVPQALLAREVRLQIRWLTQSTTPGVRAGSAFFLGIHMLGDLRPIRREILSALLERLPLEVDGQARDSIRTALQVVMGNGSTTGDYEEIGEALSLGGLQDDHASIRDLDTLMPAISEALNAGHVPAGAKPATGAGKGDF